MGKLVSVKGEFNLGRLFAEFDIGEEQQVERTAIKSLYNDFLNEEQSSSMAERQRNALESCRCHLTSGLQTYRYYIADFYSQMEKKGIVLDIDALKTVCILADANASTLNGISDELKPICTDILLEANSLQATGMNPKVPPRPESVFLAHILALDDLELISDNLDSMMEKQYAQLKENTKPIYDSFLMMNTEIGRVAKDYLEGLDERSQEAIAARKPKAADILQFRRS